MKMIAIVAVLCGSACTEVVRSPVQFVPNSVPMTGRQYDVLGTVEGQSCGDEPPMSSAYADALKKAPPQTDALVEMTIDERVSTTRFYPCVSTTVCTNLRAKAVHFK